MPDPRDQLQQIPGPGQKLGSIIPGGARGGMITAKRDSRINWKVAF